MKSAEENFLGSFAFINENNFHGGMIDIAQSLLEVEVDLSSVRLAI